MSIDVATPGTLEDQLVLDGTTADTLFLQARTASTFADDEVTDETLQAIYALTRMGPTAMNIQPLRITWVRSAEARERLAAHMYDNNKPKTLAAPMTAILSFDGDWHELLATVFPPGAARKTMFDENEAIRTTMGSNNGHLQAGYFILAARAAGLAAGPMTGFDAAGVDADFHAESGYTSFMVVNLGKPSTAAGHPRLPRLEYDAATDTV
ncbi:malonic semialdehyde reductase [Arthrobacter sp. 35W]|uniref:malonic semialdehyde reductase n=1 Tax=Arthrobacter sp. 35W TaxID=1132441 RepID=UPI0009E0230A|nr:malonic semialdehyde reductase [Arthrobacter sp. 35W]